jgi:hypothetical protein
MANKFKAAVIDKKIVGVVISDGKPVDWAAKKKAHEEKRRQSKTTKEK